MTRELLEAVDAILGGREPNWNGLSSLVRPNAQTALKPIDRTDTLIAFAIHESDDGSHWWNLAGEASDETRLTMPLLYLLAASSFEGEASRGDGLTGDEADWAVTARSKATWELLRRDYLLSAAELSRSLPSEERDAVILEIRRRRASSPD